MTEALTSGALQGTPVGTPDGEVICDSCNKGIATPDQLTGEENSIAYLYATCGRQGWFLRWIHCHDCGPVGDGEATEPGEAHALAFLAQNPLREHVEVDSVSILDSEPLEEVGD